MKERPILMNAEMVKAILDGRKTQTRRVVRPALIPIIEESERVNGKVCLEMLEFDIPCPYGQVGDRRYCRESIRTICYGRGKEFGYGEHCIEYIADKQLVKCLESNDEWWRHNWHVRPSTPIPSIHMPRWASRITLEIKAIRVERVQSISYEDAKAEGVSLDELNNTCMGDCANRQCQRKGTISLCDIYHTDEDCPETEAFGMLWDSINKKRDYGWDKNPFVWCVEFERTTT